MLSCFNDTAVDTRPLTGRYRPQTFDQVLGQPDAVAGLRRSIQSGRPTSLLLSGGTGTGKTGLASIFARAQLCKTRAPDGSPCLSCSNCASFAAGNPLNFQEFNCSKLSVNALADVLEVSCANPLGARFRIYFLDEAHGLHDRAFDLLLKVLENPGHRIFILATDKPHRIPEPLRDRLRHYALQLLDRETSLRHLKYICEREGFAYEPDALMLLAEVAGGHPRKLVGSLDKVADGVSVIREADVRRLLGLGNVAALVTYLRCVVDGDLVAQLELNDRWLEAPATKAERMQEVLLHLYETEVLGQHRPSRVMGAIERADRDRIVAGLNARAASCGISVPAYWSGLMELFDPPPGEATASWFGGRLHRLHRYVNEKPATAPTQETSGPVTACRQASSRTSPLRAKPMRLGKAALVAEAAARYLTKAKAQEIWDASSAALQLHAAPYNMRLWFRHDDLNDGQAAGVRTVGSCLHELGMALERWNPGGHGLHYAYLHQVSPRCGFTTTVVGHVPDYLAGHVDEWLFERFLPRRFGSRLPKRAVQFRITHAVEQSQQVRRHWQLVRLLCRNLDPSLLVRVEGALTPLIDVLGVNRRLREPLGAVQVPQPVRTSRTINGSAQRRAAVDHLPLLSAFQDGAWHRLATGWELDEHRDRVRVAAERAREIAAVHVVYADGGNEGERQLREMKLAELRASWPDDPRRRARLWLGWWAERLCLPGCG